MNERIKDERISALIEDRKKLNDRVDIIDKAINALRALCDHDMREDGHDSHKTHYTCTICGEKDWG